MSKNRLSLETSPYLLQHKHNPVWWYPWGEDAFREASTQDKPVFLSIGYSTCYWCHVMEKESFESKIVAEILNRDFISIKLDREERPDLDQIYMDAVVGLTGHGGWPMSVFLTAEKRPFYGGTYFPRQNFLSLLTAIADAWKNKREQILTSSDHILMVLKSKNEPGDKVIEPNLKIPDRQELGSLLRSGFNNFVESYEPVFGGFGNSPKFPPATQISLLLRLSKRLRDQAEREKALSMAQSTLQNMSLGGLHDLIAGGFHRYSTDDAWLTPHFEKMLYDNALIANSYLEAFQVTKLSHFLSVAENTLKYLCREMQSPEGCFFGALDAGEVGREGQFYVWEKQELKEILGAELFCYAESKLALGAEGNFEGKYIIRARSFEALSIFQDKQFLALREALLEARARRVRPHIDQKIICAWNGLAISAFSKAFLFTRNPDYLKSAKTCADFIYQHFMLDGQLKHSMCLSQLGSNACLDDYAFFIEGLLSLYRTELDPIWLERAIQVQEMQNSRLWEEGTGLFRYSDSKDLLFSKYEFYDNATPSALSTSLGNLIALRSYSGRIDGTQEKINSICSYMFDRAKQFPSAFSKFLIQVETLLSGPTEIKLSVEKESFVVSELRFKLEELFCHNLFLSLNTTNPAVQSTRGTIRAEICGEGVCRQFTGSREEFLESVLRREQHEI